MVSVGVEEISWRKHHTYLTLVCDHAASKIVRGAPDKGAAKKCKGARRALLKYPDDLTDGQGETLAGLRKGGAL